MKKEQNNKDRIKREKILIISILGIILVLIVIFILFKIGVFTNSTNEIFEPEEYVYYKYKQICSKDDDYFEELAWLASGMTGKNMNSTMREIKSKSTFCDTTNMINITKNELEDLTCECAERGIKMCYEGWILVEGVCRQGSKLTNPLKACSFYKCEGNYFVEVRKSG